MEEGVASSTPRVAPRVDQHADGIHIFRVGRPWWGTVVL
jgi:hypothetical protein